MKQFLEYLYDFRRIGLWLLTGAAAFAVVFALYGIRPEVAAYPFLLTVVFGVLFLIPSYIRYRNKNAVLTSLHPEKGPCGDYLPPAAGVTEQVYQSLIRQEEKTYREAKEKWDSDRKDMADYYAVWVHQIKAPIAVMRMMLQQEDTLHNRELAAELFRVEQYAEMALSYVRLGDGMSDLLIREYPLDEIVRKAIRKYAGQFIRKKIRLIYEGTDLRVVTDEKWLSFIIGQLLSNAVKYTNEGTVTITAGEDKKLLITDTGIGISQEDLPRIFEKGYTGYNGRLDKKSTGIGLYLCKTAADKLSLKLSAESEVAKGSTFMIDFNTYDLQAE